MSNTTDDSARPDTYRLHTEHLMQEFFAVRTLAATGVVVVMPVLDNMASVIASELLSRAPDAEKADEIRSQFALVLTWKIRAIVNNEKPDSDGEYGGFDAVREGARAALSGVIVTSINEQPLI